ncbi:MAG TPA: hypothetical protein VK419_08080 [Bryobacteraceae bacterium]|nr:hypothetical protein [Bryobacteraceae bacterium]
MDRIEKVAAEIERMTAAELAAFRAWFAEYDARVWDRQFEEDVRAGLLDALAERELGHHKAGRSTKL